MKVPPPPLVILTSISFLMILTTRINSVSSAKNETQATQSSRCLELKECVQCRVHHTGIFADDDEDECDDNCLTHPFPIIVDTLTILEGETFCEFVDHLDGCKFYFTYRYEKLSNNAINDAALKIQIRAQQYKDCPPEPPVFWIITIIVVSTLIMGCVCLWICVIAYCCHRRYSR